MKANLTGKDLRKLPAPPAGYAMHYDAAGRGSVPGLALRITANGSRSWILNYTSPSGDRRRATLGELGGLNLQQARARALAWRASTVQGGDGPLEAKAAKRVAAVKERDIPTFEALSKLWIERHSKIHKRRVSQANDDKILRLHLWPRFGQMKAADITTATIEQMMSEMSGIKTQANRAHSLLRTILRYGVRAGVLTADPAAGIKRFPENDRRVRLSRAELDNLYRVIEAHPNKRAGNVVKLLVWTGARSGEAFGARWSEFDLENALWERPAHRNKQGEATVTPLVPMVVEMLKGMRAKSGSEFVFPSPRNHGDPLDGIKTYWLQIRKRAGLPNLRVHDLRHVHAQALLDSGVTFDAIASLLGHSTTAMTKKYAMRSSEALRLAVASATKALAPPTE